MVRNETPVEFIDKFTRASHMTSNIHYNYIVEFRYVNTDISSFVHVKHTNGTVSSLMYTVVGFTL